ncbi:MAG TPA: SRPBCC family protein [Candidatus Limnocylindria bacterium]
MINVARSITINRPVAEVFAYVSDVSHEPAWHTDVLEARQISEGPIGIGTSFLIRVKPSMGVSEGVTHVIGFEPNRRQEMRGEMGRMRPTVTDLFEPADGGTKFTRRVQIDASGLMGLMLLLMRPMVGKIHTGFLANLKRVLEQETPRV